MTEPLIYTIKGNLPIASLEYSHFSAWQAERGPPPQTQVILGRQSQHLAAPGQHNK